MKQPGTSAPSHAIPRSYDGPILTDLCCAPDVQIPPAAADSALLEVLSFLDSASKAECEGKLHEERNTASGAGDAGDASNASNTNPYAHGSYQ